MRVRRRLTTLVAAVTFLGTLSTLGSVTPAAQADTPATGSPTTTAVAARAPHDPATYYAGTEGLSGAALAARLSTIISGHTRLSYAAVYDALPLTDPDPARPGYLIDFYSGTSILASNRCGSSCGVDGWNREHTWPQSHGSFGTTAGIGTDLFHLRPEFGSTNSSRGNKDFDDGGSAGVPLCSVCLADGDSFAPRAAVKGDLARGLLYMAVRYEGVDSLDLKMNDRTCNGSGAPNMGKLSTLVAWSAGDPPDDRERARNDLVDGTYQHNRNPFIDHPEWVGSIFGTGVGAGPACGSTTGTEYVAGGATNQAPTTAAMTATTAEDTATTVALTATDPDGDPLSWTVSRAPDTGTATVSGSTLTYTPARDVSGSVPIGVTVSDGRGGSASTTLTVTVEPVDDAPVATDVAATTGRDTSTQVTLAATDVDDPVVSLTYAVASPPAHGSVTISGSTATYVPTTGWTGADSFTYTAADPAGATSAPATVRVQVTAPPVTNRAPVASDVSATTAAGRPVVLVLAASDADGDPLTFAVASGPAHGTVSLAGDRATYTPAPGTSGADGFTFTASDATATSAPATASITVTAAPAANRAPEVRAVPTLRATAGSPASVDVVATDADGDPVSIIGVTAPSRGSTRISGPLQVTYTPAVRSGSDDFTVTVSDGRGGVASTRVGVDVAARTAGLTVSAPTVVRGAPGATTITATGQGGATPTGAVTLLAGGRAVATATLVDGVATVPTATARAGATPLTAEYGGDALFAPTTSAPATSTVTRSASVVALRARRLVPGRRGTVKVTVATVAGTAATGRVVLVVRGTKLRAPLRRGVATFRITAPRAAAVRMTARYRGDADYLPGRGGRSQTR